jgi:hypothetical protein
MKRKGMTAEEALAQLQTDPAFRARRAAQEAKLRERTARRLKAEQPLIADLARAGYAVESVWDLVNTRAGYSSAVPVLIDHLQRNYPDDVREGIARALAVPAAKTAWQLLIKLYDEATDDTPNQMKTAFACALSGAAGADDAMLDDIARLVRDRSQGTSRTLFLENLAASDRPDLHELLHEAVKDSDLAKEARLQLRRIRERRRVEMNSDRL